MLTYEQQTKKLLNKRQAVLDRIESDKAEIEKINAKLNAIQLAKIRDALGCDEQELFELITKHPEQLAKLRQDGIAESDTDTAQDSDESELIGQTSFFDEKSFKDRQSNNNNSCDMGRQQCRSAQLSEKYKATTKRG